MAKTLDDLVGADLARQARELSPRAIMECSHRVAKAMAYSKTPEEDRHLNLLFDEVGCLLNAYNKRHREQQHAKQEANRALKALCGEGRAA